MRRNSITDMRSYRAALDGTGDVSVGAYARRMLVRRVMLAGVGVLLTLAAVMLYFMLKPDRGHLTAESTITVKCVACGHEQQLVVDPRRDYPVVCPACGERAAEPVWECLRCGERFVPQGGTDDIVRCPNCGGTQVGRPQDKAAKDAGSDP